jgi:hypothetical protein
VRTILVDDVDKRLKLDWFFALTTGDFIVNRKNREEVVIPFEDKPKIIITSNFAIGESNQSTSRRVYPFAVKKVFGEDLQPRDVYGKLFWTGYNDEEWAQFDSLINECTRQYLAGKLVGLKADQSTQRRQLINNTDPEFIQYMDSQLESTFFDWASPDLKNKRVETPEGTLITNAVNVELWVKWGGKGKYAICIKKDELLTKMKTMGLGHLTMKTLTRWVLQWAKSRGVGIDPDHRMRLPKDPRVYNSEEELARTYLITALPIK